MNKPPVLNAFLFQSTEQTELGSVESPLLLRLLRPLSLALWLVIFAFEAQTVVGTGGQSNFPVLVRTVRTGPPLPPRPGPHARPHLRR